MKTVEIEVEKIRTVRRRIAKECDFDVAKLGNYYRQKEAEIKSGQRASLELSEKSAGIKEEPDKYE